MASNITPAMRDELLKDVDLGSEAFTVEAWVRFPLGWNHVAAVRDAEQNTINWFVDGSREPPPPPPTYGPSIGRKPRMIKL